LSGAGWRLLVTAPLDGPTNMAIDEALLGACARPGGRPTVRFYGWSTPTVSLGYGQRIDDAVDRAFCRRAGIALVRRATGGGAILHGTPAEEVTYSVTARADAFAGADDVLATYQVVGRGLARGLLRLGLRVDVVPRERAAPGVAAPAFCFGRTAAYELAIDGRKLCGSAQRRRAGALLQHGTVLLDADPARLRAVFPDAPEPDAALATLAGALGRRIAFAEVVDALAGGLAAELGLALVPGGLSDDEARRAERLVGTKYGTAAWTEDGRVDEALVAPGAARTGDSA
jgi:lipoate-protein ligase A